MGARGWFGLERSTRAGAALWPGLVALMLVSLLLMGCGRSPESELSGTWYVQAKAGKWLALEVTETRTFKKDGTLVIAYDDPAAEQPMPEHAVKWEVAGQWRLRISPPETSDAPPHDVLYRIEGDTLTLSDDAGETILTRDKGPSAARVAAWERVKTDREKPGE